MLIIGIHLLPVGGVAHFTDGNHSISQRHIVLSALYVAHFRLRFALIL